MAVFECRDWCFTYPEQATPALNHVTFSLQEGEFLLLCGCSGCGKTTLLRQLKPALSPHGTSSGQILFRGIPLQELSEHDQAFRIGFVMQNPDAQIVTDKVWHELAFGLENLGTAQSAIRRRVAEMASFFGIEAWFDRPVSTLSGGQKQLLSLASIMVMQPEVLLLDEPTAQLDPIAASEFLGAVKKINEELGVAILLCEQRLQEVFPMADRVAVMDHGQISTITPPREAGRQLLQENHPIAQALPSPMQIAAGFPSCTDSFPVTVREGRIWLNQLISSSKITMVSANVDAAKISGRPSAGAAFSAGENAVRLKECWFSYEKGGADILRGLSLDIKKGEFFAIVGGNGTGKSTALRMIAGLHKPYRGKVWINGKTALLPQDPQSLFVEMTVRRDLALLLGQLPGSKAEREETLRQIVSLTQLETLLGRHPYDLSGGEQQRAALAKVLLTKPDILLLDEPTKGMDASFKTIFSDLLARLQSEGHTIIMVSHDIEFCAEHAEKCALFFNGDIISCGPVKEFFQNNSFYTTAASRMSRGILPGAVTNKDVINQCCQFKNAARS